MRPAARLVLPCIIAVLSAPLSAQETATPDGRSFSATAVQTLTDGSTQVGRIYKSGQNMRLEIQTGDQTSIQIMRGGEGRAFLVDPQNQTYAEIRDPSIAQAVTGASSPCPSVADMQASGLRCELTGKGEVSGVTTQKWEIQAAQSDDISIVEWDTGRKRALTQIWPDGTQMTMTFQAMTDIEGRSVEHWTRTLQAPDQPATLGGWWFDAELRVVVREEMPGGVIRELKEITVAPVDPGLFLPPHDYKRVDPQHRP